MLTVGILGFGRLGQALAKGLKKSHHIKVIASRRTHSKAKELSKSFKIKVSVDNVAVVKAADILVLAVKPAQAESVLKALRSHFKKNQLLISVCASITNAQLQKWSGKKIPVIRAMPNLPCLINQGVTVLSSSVSSTKDHLEWAERIFQSLGKTIVLEESALDAVTALSACGPAFIFTIIESLIEAGVKVGLSRDVSKELVLRTMVGSGLMVEETGLHPAALKDQVTTPAGCTIDGLQKLEEGRLRATLLSAIVASTKRASQLKKKK